MRARKWSPSPKDVEVLCETVLSGFVEEDGQSCDVCAHCGYRYGNALIWPNLPYGQKNYNMDRLPHHGNCPVLIARDVLTGIDEAPPEGEK